jgi:hypothetical protein
MKQDTDFIQDALRFERMAANENDPTLKADLDKQAAAYRRLAERAKQRSTVGSASTS